MDSIEENTLGSNTPEKLSNEEDILLSIQFQEESAQKLIKILDELDEYAHRQAFEVWYELKKPLQTKQHMGTLDHILYDIKKSGSLQKHYQHQKRKLPQEQFNQLTGAKYNDLIELPECIDLTPRLEKIIWQLKRSIVVYLDAISDTYTGFNRDKVIESYAHVVYHMKWNKEERDNFLTITQEKVLDVIIRAFVTKTTDEEMWSLYENNNIETILPIISKVVNSFLLEGFKTKMTSQQRKKMMEDIALASNSVIGKYPLAKNTKHLYSTASSVDSMIVDGIAEIVTDATNNVLNKALSIGIIEKDVFLGNVIFLLSYGFTLPGQKAYIDYMTEYLKAKKEKLMSEQHQKIQEDKNNQEIKKSQPVVIQKAPVQLITTPLPNTIEKPLVILEQPDLLQTIICQLCLDNASFENDIFLYIQRMVVSQKDIRLAAWMKSKNIFVDSTETWDDFLVMIQNISQIGQYWKDESSAPVRTKANAWLGKQKFDAKVEAIKDISEAKLEEVYKEKKALDLMAELGIEIPAAQLGKLEEKFRALQPHYQNALKRVLHEAKSHPQLIHDKRKYRVLKFGRKYRLVLEKDMQLKDYGIYVYGEDYNKLWPDMVHNKP